MLKATTKAALEVALGFTLETFPRFKNMITDKLTIFVYHDITDTPSTFNKSWGLSVSINTFQNQISWVSNNFNIIHPNDLLSETPLPDKSALITFDDGFAGTFENGVPYLVEKSIPSVIYLNMGSIIEDRPIISAIIDYLGKYLPTFKSFAKKHGIIVPMINTAEDARSAVASVHYPPKGQRGVGLYRAQSYGTNFENYKQWCANEIVVIAQIEHRLGVENLEEIMAVDGIDGFLVGPYDLSGSYGKPGDFNDPEVQKSLETVQKYCKTGDKPGGFHVVHTMNDALKKKIDEGYQFIAYGTDMIFLTEKLRAERAIVDQLLKISRN